MLAALLLIALVAGLPWGLCRYVGWPLPDHIPAGPEAGARLTAPPEASLLLKVLACALWAIWLVFLGGVLRTAGQGLRRAADRRRPAIAGGPLKVLGAALLGAAALALLPGRDPQAHLFPAHKRPITADTLRNPAAPWRTTRDGGARAASDTAAPRESTTAAIVRPPLHGVHDSLWRIAARRLHDGDRWPEIYALNYGRRQADGHALLDPGLIRPGWVLRLPAPRPGKDPERGHPPVPPTRPAPPCGGAGTPTSPAAPPSPAPQPRSDAGLDLPQGVFIGAGTATVLATALLLAHRRRRRARHRPGRSTNQDARLTPVIRALRQASKQTPPRTATAGHPAPAAGPGTPGSGSRAGNTGRDEGRGPRTPHPTPPARVLGVKDGRDLAWALARSRGLGLVGPGALDAARALVIDLLTQPQPEAAAPAELVMTAPDAHRLLGRHTAPAPPRRLRIVANLPQALQLLETELLSRTRARTDHGTAPVPSTHTPELVLIAAVPAAQEQPRLQAILDNGSALGLAGLLIGQWRAGGTLRIRPDGTVGAASPSHAEPFAGARLFTMPPQPAAVILALLAEAAPQGPGRPPTEQNTGTPRIAPAPRENAPATPPRPPGEHEEQAPRARTPDTTVPSADAAPARRTPGRQQPLRLCLLGRLTLTYRAPDDAQPVDVTSALAPKQRELLAYLAVHREGAQRERLAAAIWPQAPYGRTSNAFYATLSQLRRSLPRATHGAVHNIVQRADARYELDQQQVSVDVWDLRDEVKAARTRENQDERQAALWRVIALYTGDFATEIAGPWREEPSEVLRRAYLDSVSALVRALRATDPNRALDLLEQARERDRYNEALYRDIARMHAQLGEHDAIPRTLGLLKRALAELDQVPSAVTLRHFEILQAPKGWDNR
ncbi:hypothetical protein AB0Q95_45520 [Streptomyces sp. NPDC059900]|uniref:hypothetical protein n=1 Tax=Streptomyces sp. NPDC059900 TaxID=3155816 RepID=UPI00341A2747